MSRTGKNGATARKTVHKTIGEQINDENITKLKTKFLTLHLNRCSHSKFSSIFHKSDFLTDFEIFYSYASLWSSTCAHACLSTLKVEHLPLLSTYHG